MTTRRQLLQWVGKTATASMLFAHRGSAAAQNEASRVTPRRGRQLLELQQRFVDLRFGMFLHFNMATFQDREWGDPSSSPDPELPSHRSRYGSVGRGCAVSQHDLGLSYDTASRWLLHLGDKDCSLRTWGGASNSIDVVRSYDELVPQGRPAEVGFYYSILSLRDDHPPFQRNTD